ncbi:DUF5514 family protein [Bacillus toyonensis]|uniref:DUF5514 family protein n=1 Tax=Bacillus toyonensis TaxID=155322 RepID=UPI001C0C6958|nr:DUF5514 family protein [Bacillus toyonensis]MBU4642991.1 DUF5514 family protein [Bacillus toyonensis]
MQTKIKDNTLGYLLSEIMQYGTNDERAVMKRVLECFRKARKGLTSTESKEKGLNVYSKRGISFTELLEEAKIRNLIASELVVQDNEEKVTVLKRTKEGGDFLRKFYTDNYSFDFMEFNEKVTALFRNQGELELDPKQIEYLYWRGDYPVSKMEETYLNDPYDSEYENEIVEFHEYLSGIKIENLKDDEYIFHFAPKLFLPDKWFYAPVKLEIEGIEIPKALVINRPYPNQRYVVAGFDKDNGIISHGFYWVKNKEELLNKPIEITLNWYVGKRKKITHKINLAFQFGEHKGKLFSNDQSLTRNTKLEQFEIKTDISKVDVYEDEFSFYDQATLTNIPIKKHSYFSADYNMDRWESRKRKEAIKQNNITEVFYNILSSAELNWEEHNKLIIKELMNKGESNFSNHGGDYGECLSIDYKKDISEEIDENWLFDKVIEFAKKYNITEFEMWKKYGEGGLYDIGFGIYLEDSLDNPTIKLREVYLGSLEDWNLSWD